jgi:hypothetical protein
MQSMQGAQSMRIENTITSDVFAKHYRQIYKNSTPLDSTPLDSSPQKTLDSDFESKQKFELISSMNLDVLQKKYL